MKIHFYSIAKHSKVDYITEATYSDNTYYFKDESLENTMNKLVIKEGNVILQRSGDTTGVLSFELGKNTHATYSNNLGLKFDFVIYTKHLELSSKKIAIAYDFYLDGKYEDTIKIYLLIK